MICSFHLVASGEDTTQHYCQTVVRDFAGTCKGVSSALAAQRVTRLWGHQVGQSPSSLPDK